MRKRTYYIVNGISLYRIMAASLLILFIINLHPEIFKWVLSVSFLTDVIDGYLARRFKVISVLGAKLDSIADDLTIAIVLTGMIVFKNEFFRQEIASFILLLMLFVLQTAFAVSRYGKMSSFIPMLQKLQLYYREFSCCYFSFLKNRFTLYSIWQWLLRRLIWWRRSFLY